MDGDYNVVGCDSVSYTHLDVYKRQVQDYFDGLKDKERLAEENVFIYTTYTEKMCIRDSSFDHHGWFRNHVGKVNGLQ